MTILFIFELEWLLAYIFIGCILKYKYYLQTNWYLNSCANPYMAMKNMTFCWGISKIPQETLHQHKLLTYTALVILSDMNVLARRFHLQKVSEDFLVNLEVRHSDGEVAEVILIQELEDLSHCSGNYSLLVITKGGCSQKNSSGFIIALHSQMPKSKISDGKRGCAFEQWQLYWGKCCWHPKCVWTHRKILTRSKQPSSNPENCWPWYNTKTL